LRGRDDPAPTDHLFERRAQMFDIGKKFGEFFVLVIDE
jgi:hypothetical protein